MYWYRYPMPAALPRKARHGGLEDSSRHETDLCWQGATTLPHHPPQSGSRALR